MQASNPGSAVSTTQTSLEVLETLCELDGARVTTVADRLDVAKSTAHKHLRTLEECGYLRKEGNRYHIGLRFLHFGEYARRRWPGFECIQNAVSSLTEETEEEVDFVAEDHGRILTIVESYHKWVKYTGGRDESQYRARIGTYYYMHATATGKAILAAYPTGRVEEIVDRWGLSAKTDRTITDREALFEELSAIRADGYAVDDEEYTDGLRSVGKAVRAPDGSVLGALSVSGPTYRIDGAVLEREIPAALDRAVEELESEIAERGAY